MDYEKAVALSKQPKNFKKIKSTHKGSAANQRCGDDITLYLVVEGEKIKDAAFQGIGCAAAIAGCSLLTEKIKGKNIEEAKYIGEGEIKKMLDVGKKGLRVERCAFLCIEALKNALEEKR